jgi:leucyl-tRNA synthetase
VSQSYDPRRIESRWQQYWAEHHTFRALNPGDPGFDPAQAKYYVLDMFPYPSGSGLHVGHPVGYIGSDIIARRKRQEGFNVLHPMGWDAFGLPTEQYAIQTGQHPSETTRDNVANFRRQLDLIGLSYDWDREVNTSHVDFYRWTQWIFCQLYDQGLAYQTDKPVWWCEALKTVLANEEVINGRSERGDHPCVRRPLRQWMFKITEYAERLLDDLEELDWPQSIKASQREWIGKSVGAEITFPVEGLDDASLTVFTTRPDTLFGATFMVIAPEHPLLDRLTTAAQRDEIAAYVASAATKSELERTDLAKDKSGVPTGSCALNPLLPADDPRARLPIFVADYVLISYGTGAIMAVPGHDTRDREYAEKFGLEIREVVRPPEGTPGLDEGACFTGDGTAVNSGPIDGLPSVEATAKIIAILESRQAGQAKTTYKLRDWLFSRQRYWGEPFPVLHLEDGTTKRVSDDMLPITLPDMTDFTPSADGSPPLARVTDWVNTVDPETQLEATRDTDTMPGWAGSCWYWLRFMDPHNEEFAFSAEAEAYWGPVDLYIGGASHAVLHLLYARFWHKVLFDIGVVSTNEPFQKLFNQGMLTTSAYQDQTGRKVPHDEVAEQDGRWIHTPTGNPVEQITAAMSKSLRNVINPDDVIAEHGVDAFRLYEMFMGPLKDERTWETRAISGCSRFLQRLWKVYVDPRSDNPIRDELLQDTDASSWSPETLELEKTLNRELKKVAHSFEHYNFNTAVAAMMSFVNEATKRPGQMTRHQAERLVQTLAPFAPHMAEELWERLGHAASVCYAPVPLIDEQYLDEDEFELVVQVLGKLRGRTRAPRSAGKQELEELARQTVASYLEGKQIIKTIVVPGRLVNFVVR